MPSIAAPRPHVNAQIGNVNADNVTVTTSEHGVTVRFGDEASGGTLYGSGASPAARLVSLMAAFTVAMEGLQAVAEETAA